MIQRNIAVGADVGGSHITCAAIDIAAGKLIPGTEKRAGVDHAASTDAILTAWASAINGSIQQIDSSRLTGFSFAIPGPFDYRQGVSKMKHKFVELYGLKISDRLMQKLKINRPLPMRFLNDATSFAVGEAWLGMGQGFERVVAVTLGTGFGSAFIDRGIPISRREDVPKEGCLWHLPYRSGIGDDYFSTRWFVQEYEKLSGQKTPNAKAIADMAGHNPDVQELFDLFGRNLSHFLSFWLRKFQADRLVIGGNIARAYSLFGPAFELALKQKEIAVSIALSRLGEKAALIGSARLFEEAFWRQIKDRLPSI